MCPNDENIEAEYVFDFSGEEDSSLENPLKECVKFIEGYKKGYIKDDEPFVLGLDEKPFKITEDRIFKLPACKKLQKLGFVDGGNAPIISSADFCISLNRVAGTVFKGSEWIEMNTAPEMIEFYTATVLTPTSDGSLEFVTRFFPREIEYRKYLPKKDIQIPRGDLSISMGRGFLPKIERFGGIARRFAEWSYAVELISSELDEGDIFVRDGSLQTGFTGESKLAHQLYVTALKKKVIVTGLSKTCRLFTNNGDSLVMIINLIADRKLPDAAWYYHPIYQITKADNQADLYFIKLHRQSYYPFRFDIYIEQSKHLNQAEREIIISNLASNSCDLSFPGYPYGLIKVDQMSRIAYKELDYHKVMILSEFNKKDYEDFILPRLRSVDAHDLLNKIRK